jgi:hypothetical protein
MIEMNVTLVVVMIDFVIIVVTPYLKIKWGNLMASTEKGQALLDKLRLYAFCVAKWWKVEGDNLIKEDITLSKSMWYLCYFLHVNESFSYL